MSGTNGISDVDGSCTAPGSESEASSGVEPRVPGFDIPPVVGPTVIVGSRRDDAGRWRPVRHAAD